jgi:hypothetical protein
MASMKFRVLWDVLPCSQVDVEPRFGGAYCLHHQDDESLPLLSNSHAHYGLRRSPTLPSVVAQVNQAVIFTL